MYTLRPPGLESAVQCYERSYPRTPTFVIGTAIVSRNPISLQGMVSWPVPSRVQNLKGSWLLDVDPHYFTNMVDA